MKAANFCAFSALAAPFGIAQTSVASSASFHCTVTGAPSWMMACMRPFQEWAITTSLSVSICAGCAPASQNLGTFGLSWENIS